MTVLKWLKLVAFWADRFLSLSKTASAGMLGHCNVRVLPIMQTGELVGNAASITWMEIEAVDG